MTPLQEFGEQIIRWLATSVETPSRYVRIVCIATLSTAQELLGLVSSGLVSDIQRLKENEFQALEASTQKLKADAESRNAEAQKRVAEATEAANKVAIAKRKDAIAQAEKDKAKAEAAKTEAEVEAIRAEIENRRIRAIADGVARVIEAVSKLRHDGGDLILDKENLIELVSLALPAESDDSETPVKDPSK